MFSLAAFADSNDLDGMRSCCETIGNLKPSISNLRAGAIERSGLSFIPNFTLITLDSASLTTAEIVTQLSR